MNGLADFLKLNICYAPDDDDKGGDPAEADKSDIDGAGDTPGDDKQPGDDQIEREGLMAKKKDGDDADDDADPDKKEPVEGERPEHIPEKFWDADKGEPKLEDMAKAYSTLEAAHTKLKASKGIKPPDSPDEYFDADKPFEVPQEADRVVVEADDPGLKGYAKIAHKHGLTKDQMQGVAKDFMIEMNQHMPEPYDAEAERAKLGKNGEAVVETNRVWIEGLYESKMLKPEHVTAAYKLSETAAGVEMLNIFRGMTGEKPIPLSANVGATMTKAEYESKMKELMDKNDFAGQEALDNKARDQGLFE